MSFPRTVPPPITTAPATETTKINDQHRNRRFFLGPMPQRVVTDTEQLVTKRQKLRNVFKLSNHADAASEDDDPLEEVIQDYAYQFFLEQGGREEDWGSERERSVRQEMLRKWRESEWGRMWRARMKKGVDGAAAARARWVGGSFEIGDFVGVNIFDGEPPRSAQLPMSGRTGQSSLRSRSGFMSAATGETFVTAHSHISTPGAGPSQASFPQEDSTTRSADSSMDSHADTSNTSLLRSPGPSSRKPLGVSRLSKANSLPNPQPKSSSALNGRISALRKGGGKGKGVAKVVRVQSVALSEDFPARPAEVPARPSEVLNRTGSKIHMTSAAAAHEGNSATAPSVSFQELEDPAAVVMQDRMVVRVCYSTEENLGGLFDEQQHRSAQHLQYLDWREFMVVWRKNRVELYEDYTIPYKELVMGHKHLSFIVPLKHARTRLSLYSFVDLTFCLTCPPTPVHVGRSTYMPFHRKDGTNIFIFKAKSRSRATDWLWRLWTFTGGQLPPVIEITSPVLDTRVKIDVPEADPNKLDYSIFSRDNLVKLCLKTLRTVQDWELILKERMAEGADLEFAWRQDTKLDWVWWLDDVDGAPREAAVVAGLALCQAGKAARLEVRVREHVPSHMHLKDGRRLSEPPGIEGYVERIKPTSQMRQATYLTVHDGLLFTLVSSHPHPPHPPGAVPPPASADDDYYVWLRASEVRRGAAQIVHARGVIDLRAIVAVRRAFQVVPLMQEHVPTSVHPEWEEEELVRSEADRSGEDQEDAGGDEGLVGADVPKRRMRRSFELVMKTGRVLRFETYSAKVAVEWIERLRELVYYWKMRHYTDTRQEMDVVHFATGRPRITPHRMWHDEDKLRPPEAAENPNAVLPYLSSVYNWCAFDGCRSIAKAGRVFVRKGIHGQYKLVQLFLVAGRIVQFSIRSGSIYHKRHGKTIHLVDAYTASGVFAAQALPIGQYSPNAPPTARRYQDGLETDDLEEDTLFVVYYYPHSLTLNTGAGGEGAARIPALGADRKLMVCRTRSKVERDVWCWAINTEIEKVARAERDREAVLRQAGKLVPL
ncbi:hypothetical protein FA95DRAFT_1554452 [Auriscalpium vulgare]|uniref:Uncharacterized protein n=1 Tax=Auriscalpium vulgare TaxID=40419 RepID=A0ACB8S5Q5_9AGAM|nr:hypothetical protein FA95DRAFT_1554452 [Auriscalpium vulgare]